MTYEEYIRSPEWARKRRAILKRDGFQCQTCLETEQLEVHHKTYANLFHEDEEDLITLCKWCHEAVTNVIRGRRYAGRSLQAKDVMRLVPNRPKDKSDVSQVPEVQDCRRVTPGYAQRPTR